MIAVTCRVQEARVTPGAKYRTYAIKKAERSVRYAAGMPPSFVREVIRQRKPRERA